MRRIAILLLAGALGVYLFIGNCPSAWAQKVLRLAETHPQDYPTTKGDYKFARLVKERTNGKILIEVYHSKQLGEEKAVIEQVQLGSIPIFKTRTG